jgi:hypothetical protein
MTFPPAAQSPAPPPAPGPFPDQDADLAGELDTILAVLDEPADEKSDEPSDEWVGEEGPDPLAQDWMAGLDGEAVAEMAAGFGDGGALDGLGPGPALAGFSQTVLDDGLGRLSDDELIGVLRASRRLTAWQDGVEPVPGLAGRADLRLAGTRHLRPPSPGARVSARPAPPEHRLRTAAYLLVPRVPTVSRPLRPRSHAALRSGRPDLRM